MFKTQAGNGPVNVDEKPYNLEHFVDLKMLRIVNAPDIVPKVDNLQCVLMCTEVTHCVLAQDNLNWDQNRHAISASLQSKICFRVLKQCCVLSHTFLCSALS